MSITKMLKNVQKHNKSETSTHSLREEKIERGCEEEMGGFPLPLFPPPSFRIVKMLAS